eukprot:SAG11_NODE_1518_length_4761_cov_2.905405_7_plen_115_part_00
MAQVSEEVTALFVEEVGVIAPHWVVRSVAERPNVDAANFRRSTDAFARQILRGSRTAGARPTSVGHSIEPYRSTLPSDHMREPYTRISCCLSHASALFSTTRTLFSCPSFEFEL